MSAQVAGGESPLVLAERYLRQGLSPIPIPYKTKAPKILGWQKLRITTEEGLRDHFNGTRINIGTHTGIQGISDVDIDWPKARAIADFYLPETGFAWGRASKPGSHRLYRTDPPDAHTRQYRDPFNPDEKTATIVEFRALKEDGTVGMQSLLPGSRHPSNEDYVFEPDATQLIQTVDKSVLESAVSRIAATALLAEYFPGEGSRNRALLALAGVLANADRPEQEAIDILWGIYIYIWGHQADKSKCRSEVQSTYAKRAGGEKVTGIPTLKSLMREPRAVDKAFEWLSITTDEAWGEPLPLSGSLPPVERLDDRLLPEVFRDFVGDISDRMQVLREFVAIPLLVALSAAVGRRARMQPKRKDVGWQVTPNLWGALCASPGYLKSPAIRAAIEPLVIAERKLRKNYEQQIVEYSRRKVLDELKVAAWKEIVKAALKKGARVPEQPDDIQPEPAEPRIIINDTTVEKVLEILADNPAGILHYRDELSGFLANLERQGREGDRSFYLEGWGGDGSFVMDRIGRGTTRVDACCISQFGGIQPARLASYMGDSLRDGPTNDGLIQRFQLFVYPDIPANWTYTDRPPNHHALDMVARIFEQLTNLAPENPVCFGFDNGAQELFIEWLTNLEKQLRDPSEHPAIVSHLSKYRSLMPSFALLFELAERASQANFEGFVGSPSGHIENFVSLKNAKLAAAWCAFLESHARRLYACIVSPEIQAARALGAKIAAGKLGIKFHVREVYLKGWTGLTDADLVRRAVAVLEDASWIQRKAPNDGPGRPAEEFKVNPRALGATALRPELPEEGAANVSTEYQSVA